MVPRLVKRVQRPPDLNSNATHLEDARQSSRHLPGGGEDTLRVEAIRCERHLCGRYTQTVDACSYVGRFEWRSPNSARAEVALSSASAYGDIALALSLKT